MRFSVEFVFNRLILRLQHRAAEMAVKHGLKRVLFPAEGSVPAGSVELPDLTSVLNVDIFFCFSSSMTVVPKVGGWDPSRG